MQPFPSAAGPANQVGFGLPRPSRLSSAPASPSRLPAETRDPRHPRFYLAALRTPVSSLLSLPFPLGSSRNPAPRVWGRRRKVFHPHQVWGVNTGTRFRPPPSPVCKDFQVELSPLLSFRNIPVPAFCYHPNFGRYSVLSFVSAPNNKLRVFEN